PLTRGWADDFFSYANFWLYHGHLPHMARPRSFSEHLFRMKLGGALSDPLRQFVSDKEHVKTYVAAVAGPRHVVPTLAVLRSPEEAEAFDYPPTCMVKPTHSSGRHILRRNANAQPDMDTINSWFAHSKYRRGRETNYRFLKPKIMVEELL